jgi:hypothetical protein
MRCAGSSRPNLPPWPRRWVGHERDDPITQSESGNLSSGRSAYDTISRGIADSIEHCVLRLGPKQGKRILDLATDSGWTPPMAASTSGPLFIGFGMLRDASPIAGTWQAPLFALLELRSLLRT